MLLITTLIKPQTCSNWSSLRGQGTLLFRPPGSSFRTQFYEPRSMLPPKMGSWRLIRSPRCPASLPGSISISTPAMSPLIRGPKKHCFITLRRLLTMLLLSLWFCGSMEVCYVKYGNFCIWTKFMALCFSLCVYVYACTYELMIVFYWIWVRKSWFYICQF